MTNLTKLSYIDSKIVKIRNQSVMLDRDLAELYNVETRVLNQAVKRNIERFPIDFMFKLTRLEFNDWISQYVMSNSNKMGLRRLPYAFTEIGCFAVAGILNSETAKKMSVFVYRAFVDMKKQIQGNSNYELLNERLKYLESQTQLFQSKSDALQSELMVTQMKQSLDVSGQAFEIESLNDKLNELLVLFNGFRDSMVVLKKDDILGNG